jgi:hypothetical protein
VSEWAKGYSSKSILSVACKTAAQMINSDETDEAATMASLGFLTAVAETFPNDEDCKSLIYAFCQSIAQYMGDAPDTNDWDLWTNFLRKHRTLFNETDMEIWKELADEFCSNEVDLIIKEASSSEEALARYSDVTSLAEGWSLALDKKGEVFKRRLDELISREEERRKDDDRPVPQSPSAISSDDDAIDRLFDSLNERAAESDG